MFCNFCFILLLSIKILYIFYLVSKSYIFPPIQSRGEGDLKIHSLYPNPCQSHNKIYTDGRIIKSKKKRKPMPQEQSTTKAHSQAHFYPGNMIIHAYVHSCPKSKVKKKKKAICPHSPCITLYPSPKIPLSSILVTLSSPSPRLPSALVVAVPYLSLSPSPLVHCRSEVKWSNSTALLCA